MDMERSSQVEEQPDVGPGPPDVERLFQPSYHKEHVKWGRALCGIAHPSL